MGLWKEIGKAVLGGIGLLKKVDVTTLFKPLKAGAAAAKESLQTIAGLRNQLGELRSTIQRIGINNVQGSQIKALTSNIRTQAQTGLNQAEAALEQALGIEKAMLGTVDEDRARQLVGEARKALAGATHAHTAAEKFAKHVDDSITSLEKLTPRERGMRFDLGFYRENLTEQGTTFGLLSRELNQALGAAETALNEAQESMRFLAQTSGIGLSAMAVSAKYDDGSITTGDLLEAGLETIDVLTTGPIEQQILGKPSTEKLDKVFGAIEHEAKNPVYVDPRAWMGGI